MFLKKRTLLLLLPVVPFITYIVLSPHQQLPAAAHTRAVPESSLADARRRAHSPAPPLAPAGESHVVSVSVALASGARAIRIRLRPDLSPSSAAWWRQAAQRGCSGSLYRNEDNSTPERRNYFLIQGRIDCPTESAKNHAPAVQVIKGDCPSDSQPDPNRKCPDYDPHCGCHGPLFKHGMVGWAGGGTGPDWFIFTGQGDPGWGHDHTVIGEIADDASWRTIDAIHALPVNRGGMTMLKEALKLTVMA